MIHWVDCDCSNRRKKCEFAPDFVPAGYRWDGGIWAASFKRVGDLLLYGGKAAEVVWCAAPDGAEGNHTIKGKEEDMKTVAEMTPEKLKTSEYWVIMPPHDSHVRWKDVRSSKILHWVDGDLCGGSVDFYGPDCRIWPISLLDSGLEVSMHWHEYVAWTSTASPEIPELECLRLSVIGQAYRCLAACASTEAAFCGQEKHALQGDYTPGMREADSEVIDRQRQQALQALEDLAFYVASTLKVLNVVVFPGAGTAERWRIEGMLAKLKREGTQHADVRKSLPSLLVTLLSCLVEYTSDSIKSPVQLAEVISASVLKLGTRKAEGDIMQIEIPVEDFNKLVASGL